MSDLKAPCEQFPEEDYSFDVNEIATDPENGDVYHQVDSNPRCLSCFYKEECVNKVMIVLWERFNVPKSDFCEVEFERQSKH